MVSDPLFYNLCVRVCVCVCVSIGECFHVKHALNREVDLVLNAEDRRCEFTVPLFITV